LRPAAGSAWGVAVSLAAAGPSLAVQPGQPVQFRLLADLPWLRHGITTRDGPGLAGNLSFSRGPDEAAVIAARARWSARIGVIATDLVLVRQVHGTAVDHVLGAARGRGALAGAALPEADAMVTAAPGVPLLAVVADCVPIMLVDPIRRVVAVAHAGWRGTVAGIAESVVAALRDRHGSRPSDLLAGIGPSIGPCCYTVGLDVAQAAVARYGAGVLRTGPTADNPVLDLWEANRLALVRSGVAARHIEVAGLCTRCHNALFFSHRAEGPTRGLFGAIVALSVSSEGGW
jgi:YfiH family protein